MNAHLGQRELRDNIRTIVKDRGLKYRAIAEVLDLPVTKVNNMFHGQWWSREQVEAVAEFLEIEADEIIGESIFQDQVAAINAKERAEEDARHRALIASAREKMQEEAENERAERQDSQRALCCKCGALRLVRKGYGRNPVSDLSDPYINERGRGRTTVDLKCKHCNEITRHAVLRDGDAHADRAEHREPTAEQKARTDRDRLVERLTGFNIDVTYRALGRPKYRAQHGTPVVALEYDESKSQWRIELNPDVTPSVQLPVLQRAWDVVASDDQDFWEGDLSPETGCWMFPRASDWDGAIDGLIDEIQAEATTVLLDTATRIQNSTDTEGGA
jgi:hypothetical protein